MPKTIIKSISSVFDVQIEQDKQKSIKKEIKVDNTLEPKEIEKMIQTKNKEMKEAAKNLEFEKAATLRDELRKLYEIRLSE